MAPGGLALSSLRGPAGSSEMEPEEGEDRTPLLKEPQPDTGETSGSRPCVTASRCHGGVGRERRCGARGSVPPCRCRGDGGQR